MSFLGAKSSDDVGVSQTPRDVFRKADGDDITLSFTQTHANCDTIQWYRRVPGSRFLQLVALANYQKASVEPAFTDCVNVSGDGRTAAQLRILTHRWPDDGGHFLATTSTHGLEGARQCPTKTLLE